MPDPAKKVILITGTSSGIGAACANYLFQRGHKVYGGSRTKGIEDTFHWIKMDCTKEEEVRSAVEFIVKKEGHIDVLVNNAGINLAGAIEEISCEEAKMQFETNVFGALSMIRIVLPYMRKNRSGVIINISSIGGIIGLPFQGMYSSSKFALEGLTESLRLEIKNSGVQATLIEPGDFCTPITNNRIINTATRENTYYSENFARTMEVVAKDECSGTDPILIAALIEKLIFKRRLKARYVIGKFSERLAVVLKRILAAEIFEKILIKKYRL